MQMKNHAVLRKPLQDFSFYKQYLENFNFNTAFFLFGLPPIQNAIQNASSDLAKELELMFATKIEKANVLLSFYKYLLRATTRCTPFGLFAACGVVHLNQQNNQQPFVYYAQSSIDNEWLANTIHQLKQNTDLLEHLSFKVNPTAFQFNGYFRCVRTIYNDKNQKTYSVFAIKSTDLLKQIFKKGISMMPFQNWLQFIQSEEEESTEAKDFLLQLIAIDFIVSDFDISLTTANDLERLAKKLPSAFEFQKTNLLTIDQDLKNLDNQWSRVNFDFNKFNQRHLIMNNDSKSKIQTDLYFKTNSFYWSNKNERLLKETINFLQKTNSFSSKEKSQYTQLKHDFVKRFEHQMIPLLEIMDVECGLNFGSKYFSPDAFISQFNFPTKTDNNQAFEWTPILQTLQKKRQISQENNWSDILLNQADFAIQDNHHYFPTYTAMIECFSENQENHLSLVNVSQGGMNKLIGRFTHGNLEILALAKANHQKESEFLKDFLLVEIIHLPENRVGNVIKRQAINPLEIQFLGYSENEEKNIISLNDLFVTVREDKLILWSKKYNKRVLPMLSNAHNFVRNETPIYDFLCGLYSHYFDSYQNISWGILTDFYDYFPRVYFKEVLLIKETWIINKDDFNLYMKFNNNDLNQFIAYKRFKPIVQWVNGDQTLVIDFRYENGHHLFKQIVNKFTKSTFEEYVFSNALINGEGFANQLIVFGES